MTNVFSSLTPEWFRARRYHILSPLLTLGLVALFELTPQLSWLADLMEDQTVNLRFMARAPFDPPADPRLIFVGIDELSVAKYHRMPWPRSVYADFLKMIIRSGMNPHTITFDLMFTEPSFHNDALQANGASPGSSTGSTTVPPQTDDGVLADTMSNFPSIITGALITVPPEQEDLAAWEARNTEKALADPGPTQPLTHIRGNIGALEGSDIADIPVPEIRSQGLFAFVNDNPSVDDIRHTLPLAIRLGRRVYPSLALQTLCQMLGVDPDKVEIDLPGRQVRLTDISKKVWTIPIDARCRYTINYRRQDQFRSVGFYSLVQNIQYHLKGDPIAPDCQIDNRTLLIGEAATGLADMGPSPLQARSPLPYAHMNVMNNVLKHDYLSFVPFYWVTLGWLIVTWTTLFRLRVAPLTESVGMPILVVVIYIIMAFAIFGFFSMDIALAWPVLGYTGVNFGGVVLRWRDEQRKIAQLRSIFSQMVSSEVMNHILKNPENLELGGSDRPSTIMFTDIRDYTGFSEGKTAEEVMDQLNDYFERMVRCVKENKGTLHKFIGDAVMAAWGDIADASLGPEQDARNAVRAALLMRPKLRELNEERIAKGLIPLRIGIGLNHGMVQAGMLGSSERKEFTVIGDEVNVASRLEGITKEFKTDIAVSESVRALLGDDFLLRRLGFIQLKGKEQATLVYEVLAERSELLQSKMSPDGVARYEDAFGHFLARRFGKAIDGFEACAKDYPDDFCVTNYLAASREFIVAPPPDSWDGRIVMTTK